MSAVKIESPRGQTWSKVEEIRLFKWMMLFKPAGIHKHFHMVCLLERLNKPDQYPIKLLQSDKGSSDKVFSGEDVWEQLSRYYNLEKADEVENQPYPDIYNDDGATATTNEKTEGDAPLDNDDDSDNDDDNSDELKRNIIPLQNRLQQETEFELSWEDYGELMLEHARDHEVEGIKQEETGSVDDKAKVEDVESQDTQVEQESEEPQEKDIVEKDTEQKKVQAKQEIVTTPPASIGESVSELANEPVDAQKKPRTRRSTRLTRSQKRGIDEESENEEDQPHGGSTDEKEDVEHDTEGRSGSEKESTADAADTTATKQVTFANKSEGDAKESANSPTGKAEENETGSSQQPRPKKQKVTAAEEVTEDLADVDSPARRTRRKSITKPTTRLSSRLRSRK
ncbi:Eaf7 [Kluyveromyces lactis]|nr:Eaf7 [Kluyveromyces lactis]